MNGRLFGVCFSVFGHKNGTIAPVDYLSTFATAPISLNLALFGKILVVASYGEINL